MYWAVFGESLPLKVPRETLQGTGLIVLLWGLNTNAFSSGVPK